MNVRLPNSSAANALSAQTTDFLEGLLEGFVAYDGNWVMTYVNASGERLLGRRREDVLGKTWHEAFPHAVGNPIDEMYQRVMRTRSPERMEYYYPHYQRWMEISAAPVRSGGVAVYFRDVDDRVRAARELAQQVAEAGRAQEALREADRRKDEFLATLAHELRNPLAPIRSALHLLRIVPPDSAPAGQAREIMERQLGHLVRLVDDLLEVSRITRGKIELRTSRVDLAAVVQSAVETSRPALEAGRHGFELNVAEGLHVEADFVRLAQVIANLLNNAAKYTDPGGRIELSLQRECAEVCIRVRDNGVGIAPEMLPRVFDMFTQGDASAQRSQGGLGIGLALARSLVEMHGGKIAAQSAGLGRGSEFCVTLPLGV